MIIKRGTLIGIILVLFFSVLPAEDFLLEWNTFHGTGLNDHVKSVATDSSGNIYLTGQSAGAWGSDPKNGYTGGTDIFVAKLSPEGDLIWHTFFGSGDHDQGMGIAVDNSGNIFVIGYSESNWGDPQRNFSNSGSGYYDGVLIKLHPTGEYHWHTFLGGDHHDYGNGIALGSSGEIYVIMTSRANWGEPLVDYANEYGEDICIAKLNFSGVIDWNTFPDDSYTNTEGYGITLGLDGYIYFTGHSGSDNWGTLPVHHESEKDLIVVAKMSTAGTLAWHTCYGSKSNDTGYGICLARDGDILVTGISRGRWGDPIAEYSGGSDAFVAKFSPAGAMIWNTFPGGSGSELGKGIVSDSMGNIYITGRTDQAWEEQPAPAGLSDRLAAAASDYDIFVAKLEPDGGITWHENFGSGDEDEGNTLAMVGDGALIFGGFSAAQWGSPINNHTGTGWDDMAVGKLVLSPATETKEYSVTIKITTVGGIVDKKYHSVPEGKNCVFTIYPDKGYEIDQIIDNGREMEIANPYMIGNITEDHTVLISFKKTTYPPQLELTGVRKADSAWIISKEYTELTITITEHEDSPAPVASYELMKKVNGLWTVIQSYTSPESHEYRDKLISAGESAVYKLVARGKNGEVLAETVELIL